MTEQVAPACRRRRSVLALAALGLLSLAGTAVVAGPLGAPFQVRVTVVNSCDVEAVSGAAAVQDCGGGSTGSTSEANHVVEEDQPDEVASDQASVEGGARVITITF